jgi:hypothetical protein
VRRGTGCHGADSGGTCWGESLQPFLRVGNLPCWSCSRGPRAVHPGKTG